MISGISNLTNQEAELEREKQKIMAQLGGQLGGLMKKNSLKAGGGGAPGLNLKMPGTASAGRLLPAAAAADGSSAARLLP